VGRRRIGKSTLIEQFSKRISNKILIQGLGPEQSADNEDQLTHFSKKLAAHFRTGEEKFSDWENAFQSLAEKTKKGEWLILLDEISWMGHKDKLFANKLKDAWDQLFKKNPRLMLVLCGSVSSWIEENILQNTAFVGRVSLTINLRELNLFEVDQFWKKNHYKLSSTEKLLILSVAGGVPKYLEEILKNETAEQNILNLSFNQNGIFYNEFEYIFRQIFSRRSGSYEKIIKACLEGRLSPSELGKKIGRPLSSELTKDIHHLELAGFLSRDFYFNPNGELSKNSHLRVRDNYLRFFYKVVLPNKAKIDKGGVKIRSLSQIPNFQAIKGYQFENLILANRELIVKRLGIEEVQIVSCSPFSQRKTLKNKGACQIDLLIECNLDVLFLCEFKTGKIIDKNIITEVTKKIKILQRPKRYAVKPVLVYHGELYPAHQEEISDFFFKMISFDDLLAHLEPYK
jgi:AAA+ ATPase superfamily predicted ATPase